MKLNAQFHHKQSEFKTSPAEIEKIIELSRDEFRSFLQYPQRDYSFITENADCMKMDTDGVYHCLLVVGEGHDDGILIEAESYDHARYSAYVPGARQFVENEIRPMCIKKLENSLTDAVDEVVSCAHAYDGDGEYRALISDLKEVYGFDEAYVPLLLEMLNDRERLGVLEFEVIGDEIFAYRDQPEQKEKPHHRPGEDELKVMCAKHVLWNHDVQGGEQADFTNMDLTDSYLVNSDLNGAIFKNTILNASTLGNGSYTQCDFTGAEMIGVDAVDAFFEESDFTGAKLINCHFLSSHFSQCNFTGADLSGSDFNLASLDNCDFTDANIEAAKLENARMDNCTGLPDEPDEDEEQGMTMQ